MSSSEMRKSRASLIVAAVVAALALALGLAACGGGGGGIEGGGNRRSRNGEAGKGKPSGSLTISNWPLYIDKETIPNFEKATGISVKYIEDINSNEEFFAKMQPLLQEGESGGRSIFVLAGYEHSKMYKLGYLQNLDKSAMPNVEKNMLASLRHPPFDPDRSYSVPWQSGMTGVIVNKELAPERALGLRPLRLPVQGQGRLPQRSQGNGAAGDEVRRHRSRKGDRSRLDEGDRQNQGRRRIGPDPPLHRQRLPERPDQRQRGRGDRVVGRRGAAPGRQPEPRMADADRGLHAVVRRHGDPGRGAEPDRRRGVHELRLRPEERGQDRRIRQLRDAGRRRQGDIRKDANRNWRRTR